MNTKIPPKHLFDSAYELLDYIERARTHGVVVHSNVAKQLSDLQCQNSQLKEEKDKLQKENTRLKQLNDALHQTIEFLGAKRMFNDDSGEPIH